MILYKIASEYMQAYSFETVGSNTSNHCSHYIALAVLITSKISHQHEKNCNPQFHVKSNFYHLLVEKSIT